MSDIALGLTFNDVLLVPQYSNIPSRSQVDLTTKLTPNFSIKFPLTAANMDTVVGVDMAVTLSKLGSIAFYPRFATIDDQASQVRQILSQGAQVIPSVGIKPGEYERAKVLLSLGIKVLLVDVAHAHQQACLDFIKKLKTEFRQVELIVGAAATYSAARDLFRAGADSVKVGVGPGSACTTRIVTGSGMPQLTAISECYRAAKEFKKPIIADGGMKNSGDVAKALAAGADAAMSGNLFAGTLETPGEVIEIDGQKFKSYNGSASAAEKQRQFKKDPTDKTREYTKYVEGLERRVPLKGSVVEVIDQIDKGIRSAFTYSGAKNISEFHRQAHFIQVTSSVIHENQNRDLSKL